MRRFTILLLCIVASSLYGQADTTASTDSTREKTFWESLSDKVTVSGELGANGELYSVSGRAARRPGKSGKLYFRPSVNLYDHVTLSVDLFLSSEGNGARQSINTVGFTPEWSWGRLYYGDFNMQVSQFSLTDITISGAGIELNPGIWRFKFGMGTSQKAVLADPNSSMYRRTVYSGKVGIGDESGWHLHFNFLRAYDDKNSLPRSLFTKIDTVSTFYGKRIDTTYSGVAPAENMVIGSNWGLALFNKAFRMKAEMALSLYTADMYSQVIENKDIPSQLNRYFTPHISSRGDGALYAEATIATAPFNSRSAFTYVGPGYASLGMGSLISDKMVLNNHTGLNLFSGALTIATNFMRQTDNTAKQKLYTTSRDALGLIVAMRPLSWLNITVGGNQNNMGNDAAADSIKLETKVNSLNANVSVSLNVFGTQNTVSVNVGNQEAVAKRATGESTVTADNLTINLNTSLTKGISTDLGYSTNSVTVAKITSENNAFTAKVNQRMLSDKLTNTLSYTSGDATASKTTTITFSSEYQVFAQSSFSVQYRRNQFENKGTAATTFIENTTSFNWVFRF